MGQRRHNFKSYFSNISSHIAFGSTGALRLYVTEVIKDPSLRL